MSALAGSTAGAGGNGVFHKDPAGNGARAVCVAVVVVVVVVVVATVVVVDAVVVDCVVVDVLVVETVVDGVVVDAVVELGGGVVDVVGQAFFGEFELQGGLPCALAGAN